LHGRFELSGIDFSSGFGIEQIEGLSELFDFIFSEAGSFDFLLLAGLGGDCSSFHFDG
jgi:hypothetical protein